MSGVHLIKLVTRKFVEDDDVELTASLRSDTWELDMCPRHCVISLDKKTSLYIISLYLSVLMGTSDILPGVTIWWISIL